MADDSPSLPRRWWHRALLPVGIAALIVALVGVLALSWADDHAAAVARANAEQAARTNQGRLNSELQKFRLLPLVLTEYPEVAEVLGGAGGGAVERLNAKLELLAERTDAAVIYVIGADGRTMAASNWRLPTSFVGQNYGFRPYFQEALRTGASELFALGTVSNRPGLFIARRVGSAERPLGVIVVKVEFDAIEAEWARAAGPTYVTDSNGVVIITSRPDWRFRTTRPVDAAIQARVREAVQYGRGPLQPLPVDVVHPSVEAAEATAMTGAHVHVLEPLGPALDSARFAAWAAILAAALLSVMVLALILRLRERAAIRAQAQRALEEQVELRTAELKRESAERAAADQRYRAAREELAQANRLASLGQIVTGVVHEINQPVAAIRTFADSGMKLLDRDRVAEAKENLGLIADLTARIGRITSELRGFARRRVAANEVVAIGTVIDGALLLIGDRMRSAAIRVERTGDEGLTVDADRVRLEQILINLLQNAADALEDRETPHIRITTRSEADRLIVEVADNGPGVDAELKDQLFTPFATGRPDGLGLGLGLAIARDIAREFGGDLALAPSPLGGAAFRLSLKAA